MLHESRVTINNTHPNVKETSFHKTLIFSYADYFLTYYAAVIITVVGIPKWSHKIAVNDVTVINKLAKRSPNDTTAAFYFVILYIF